MIDPHHEEGRGFGEGPVDRILCLLAGTRRSGAGWVASCPAHDDRNPSLSVSAGDDGRVLLHCHAGCSTQAVLEALNLTSADLFTSPDAGTGFKPEAVYRYENERGALLYEVVRLQGKRFRQRRPDGAEGHVWNMQGVERVLYRLPELKAAVGKQTIFVVEGEKDADAIYSAGGVATTSVGGAGKWRNDYNEALRGADVVIVADQDEAGYRHAEQVRASLEGVAVSVQIVVAKEGKDASDHLAAGHGLDEFESPASARADLVPLSELSVDAILAARPEVSKDELLAENPNLKALLGGKESLANEIVKLVHAEGIELSHDQEQRGYGSYWRDGHRETWPLKSKTFKNYLRWLSHSKLDKTPNAQALGDALGMLEADALFDGDERPVFIRVAGTADAIYIDLCDPDWRAIEVTRTGWEIVSEPPVYFRRVAGMAALPLPTRNGSLEELRRFVNLSSDDDYRLLAGWLLAALRPPGQPYPVLILHGEQGSAKSTSARMLRELVDPSSVPLRAAPRDLRDLMVSAKASWMLCFDNLSRLDHSLSDALCRMATGGGFTTRELYTDDEEVIFEAQRPVVMNGIEELATRSDLLDRSLLLNLPRIPAQQRRNEKELWAAFEQAKPAILGGLLDALVSALVNLDAVKLETPPRMADFARWVTAAEPGLSWPAGSFMASYESNRGQAHELAIEASPAGQALVALAGQGFRGTASELLQTLTDATDEKATRQRDWPGSPRKLSGLVKRLAPNLRELGYTIEFSREPGSARRRMIEIRPNSVLTVPTVPDSPERHDARDGTTGNESVHSPERLNTQGRLDMDRDARDDRDDAGDQHNGPRDDSSDGPRDPGGDAPP